MLALANNTVWCDSLWDIDDFSVCGRQLFLELWLVLPLGISILLVASNFLFVRTGTDNYDASSKLDAEQQPLLGSHLRKYSSVKEDTDISPLKRHFDISLIQPVEQDGTIKFVFRGFGEKLSVALEFLLLLVQTGFTIVALPEVEPYTDSPYWFAKYVSPTLWVYLTLITVIRLYNVSQGLAPERIDLWTQSSILYNAQWFCSAMFFRSALLDHAPSALAANYFYTQFGINTALVFINGFQKFSDKPAPVYEKDGIPPSPETTSTLFNIVTYSWIDKMVFKAYAKPITLNEIWGLRLDDTSHVVLSKFHQLNSKTRFTIRLLLQFKEPLFLQSVYACEHHPQAWLGSG
ncbi:hypothetical protein OGAPHI_001022 [Ogataea philodendri]|uniref:Uncharacterized protein n=1 Tax=Ogataea philodendri TaxID=1378263 RepID=A0A9P8PER1_9ASCO|nr:uncharacterized protein OGAPHI_001022 [Ogataea philodendri]KAH3670507.1 hypothetical protein OGAPHI_001022 [Ogataea philodendri]